MDYYQSKTKRISGSRDSDIVKEARLLYRQIEKRSKRRAYIRSVYFHKEKVFFDNFWIHLSRKSFNERARRLRFLPCAIELIEKSHFQPISKIITHGGNAVLYRFCGKTNDQLFYVQIKEDRKREQKFLMSVFPAK